jgi:hypothetical protein
MASTRNKNTQGDYALEQTALFNKYAYHAYEHSHHYGVPIATHFAGNGLVGMKTPHRNLSSNYCDVESQLFGIGSTNLVTPLPTVQPQINQYQSLNVADRTPLIIPAAFQNETYHRHMFLN